MISKKKFFFLVFALSFVLVFLIMSCNEPSISENTNDVNLGTALMKDSLVAFHDGDKKPPCGSKDVVVWNIDHYFAINGRKIGIWSKFGIPGYGGKWGFEKVFVSSDTAKNIAKSNGYILENIRGKIKVNEDGSISYPHQEILGSYEIDEPFEREQAPFPLSTDDLISIINEVQENTNNSKVLISSWKKSSAGMMGQYYDVLNNTQNSKIICDQYYAEGLTGCGTDQRSHWTTFKYFYTPNHVESYWVHLLIDGEQGEFGQLFGHANNLGIKEIWLYAGDADGYCGTETLTEAYYNLYLNKFATAAWQNYWLGAIQRKYIYEYHCTYPNPCDCDRDNMEGWVLYKVWPMNEYREIYPDGSYNDLPPEN